MTLSPGCERAYLGIQPFATYMPDKDAGITVFGGYLDALFGDNCSLASSSTLDLALVR
jgi:hypothetical protein